MLLFVPHPIFAYLAWFLLLAEWGKVLTERPPVNIVTSILRFVLIGLGFIGMVLTAVFTQDVGSSLVIPVLIIVLLAEVLGRWQFYARRKPFPVTSS